MKSDVETLNPTRVRLTVEVPFDELRPSLDAAYKRIAGQIVLPGFRRGKVPPQIIDQRFGRGVVLEEAINEALPRFYSRAVQDNSLQTLGQPEVDVTELGDGTELKFTAEVDIRPDFELPAYEGIAVTVPDADVSEDDVNEQVTALQERFATLTGVDRPVESGDFVSIDLVAVDAEGEEIEDGKASGMSYEVGSETMIDGLDEALVGLSADESADFATTLVGGERAGEEVQVTATVRSVKERELPELDDDFAQTASEFDTVDELRDDIRQRLERMRKLEQGVQARDKTLEELLTRVDIPLPESLVQEELAGRNEALDAQLEAAGMTRGLLPGGAGADLGGVRRRHREASWRRHPLPVRARQDCRERAARRLRRRADRAHPAQSGSPGHVARRLRSAGGGVGCGAAAHE